MSCADLPSLSTRSASPDQTGSLRPSVAVLSVGKSVSASKVAPSGVDGGRFPAGCQALSFDSMPASWAGPPAPCQSMKCRETQYQWRILRPYRKCLTSSPVASGAGRIVRIEPTQLRCHVTRPRWAVRPVSSPQCVQDRRLPLVFRLGWPSHPSCRAGHLASCLPKFADVLRAWVARQRQGRRLADDRNLGLGLCPRSSRDLARADASPYRREGIRSPRIGRSRSAGRPRNPTVRPLRRTKPPNERPLDWSFGQRPIHCVGRVSAQLWRHRGVDVGRDRDRGVAE